MNEDAITNKILVYIEKKCMYVTNGVYFFFLCALGTPQANSSAAFPESAAMPQCCGLVRTLHVQKVDT